jgi:Flp pilus assembly protein TadG
MRIRSRRSDDTGAAAVELALVLLVLVTFVLGTLEFGRLFFVQSSLTNAARVAARTMAIEAADPSTSAGAVAAAKQAAATTSQGVMFGPAVSTGQVAVSPATCSTGTPVVVTITYSFTELTGFFPAPFPSTLYGKASVLCAG